MAITIVADEDMIKIDGVDVLTARRETRSLLRAKATLGMFMCNAAPIVG